MLESACLLIQPWTTVGAVWTRVVADGTSGTVLGTVRWLGPHASSWLDWLRNRRLNVLETEDNALLLMLVRPWGLSRYWDLYDADERRVGTIDGPILFDSEGGRRGFIERGPGGGRLLDPAGRLLAAFVEMTDGTMRLTQAANLEANPFLRMLLLGGVLIQDVPPARRRTLAG